MMSRFLSLLAALFWVAATQTQAQDLSALAHVDPAKSEIRDEAGGVRLELGLTQGVPWRVFTLDEPRRLVVDFREVDWSRADKAVMLNADLVSDVRFGGFLPGWSRMVMDLTGPLAVSAASMAVDEVSGAAQLDIRLDRTSAEEFGAASGMSRDPRWDLPEPAQLAVKNRAREPGDLVTVMLDPGHGGVDPGAERGGEQEKELMLRFAREIREALLRSGGFQVMMTRDEDVFVSLEARVARAHQAGADVFISLHADSLSQGNAHGATVYTLSDKASDKASALLAERHDRDTIIAGVDLTGADDVVADVLLDLARMETRPRTERLAKSMVRGMGANAGGQLNKRPHREAAFSVLKAADIPSVLIEVGFMSSDRDLANLRDPVWRALMADGIRDGLQAWVVAEKERGALR